MHHRLRTKLVAAVVVTLSLAAGAVLVQPGPALADSPRLLTTDGSPGGWAQFSSAHPESITVHDTQNDELAALAYVRVRQPDGSWVERMRARANGADTSAGDSHNITEGRRVELTVCLQRGSGPPSFCATWRGTA